MGHFSLEEVDKLYKEKTKMDRKIFTDMVKKDAGFKQFVEDVSPSKNGKQPVFFSELFLILQILWEIYSWMKKLGWFSRWLTVFKVKRAMVKKTPDEQQAALQVILDKL